MRVYSATKTTIQVRMLKVKRMIPFLGDFGSDFMLIKTKNWTSCSKQVNEKPQKKFLWCLFYSTMD